MSPHVSFYNTFRTIGILRNTKITRPYNTTCAIIDTILHKYNPAFGINTATASYIFNEYTVCVSIKKIPNTEADISVKILPFFSVTCFLKKYNTMQKTKNSLAVKWHAAGSFQDFDHY